MILKLGSIEEKNKPNLATQISQCEQDTAAKQHSQPNPMICADAMRHSCLAGASCCCNPVEEGYYRPSEAPQGVVSDLLVMPGPDNRNRLKARKSATAESKEQQRYERCDTFLPRSR